VAPDLATEVLRVGRDGGYRIIGDSVDVSLAAPQQTHRVFQRDAKKRDDYLKLGSLRVFD
jgi:hypothetical protein